MARAGASYNGLRVRSATQTPWLNIGQGLVASGHAMMHFQARSGAVLDLCGAHEGQTRIQCPRVSKI